MAGRRWVAWSVAGTVIVAVTACVPHFSTSSTLTVSQLGQLAKLTWPAAVTDDASAVAQYGIEVDGTEVARVPASAGTSCVLTGLAGGATATVSVTAYGRAGADWSGGGLFAGHPFLTGRISTSFTDGTGGAPAGATRGCVSPTDTDGDRLPDAVETGTGVFVSAASTGTDPTKVDTDVDGLTDGEEVLDTTGGLQLHQLGTRPTKKDVLLETDWMDDSFECGAHSHRPKPGVLADAKAAYAGMSSHNPDGTTGVNLIVDDGQGGVFTGGNLIPTASLNPVAGGMVLTDVGDSTWNVIKQANLAPNRRGYFHWDPMLHADLASPAADAEMPGDDLNTPGSACGRWPDDQFARLLAHELGHNLNLDHGGSPDGIDGSGYNYKPNYPSVMNYRYQVFGIDTNCDATPDGVDGFSAGTRPPLNESALSEAAGVCGVGNGPAIDWNRNGSIQGGVVAADINRDWFPFSPFEGSGDGSLNVLKDYDDGANIDLTGVHVVYPWESLGAPPAPAPDAGFGVGDDGVRPTVPTAPTDAALRARHIVH